MTAIAQRNLDAEARALSYGHHAWAQADGAFEVVSESRRGLRHRVTHFSEDGLLHFVCTCEAGTARVHVHVPCWHSAVTARSLERRGRAVWHRGYWWEAS